MRFAATRRRSVRGAAKKREKCTLFFEIVIDPIAPRAVAFELTQLGVS